MHPRHFCLILLLSLCAPGLAQPSAPALRPAPDAEAPFEPQPAGFIENKGQIRQTDGQPAPGVLFALERGHAQIFLLRGGGIAWQFSRRQGPEGPAADSGMPEDQPVPLQLETWRMDLHFAGANPDVEAVAEGRSREYFHYHPHQALDVHHYQQVTFRALYPGIDWVVYPTEQGMKYDFLVHPGADPSQIRMQFTHQEELHLDAQGNLVHGNRMGRFIEAAPVSRQDGRKIATRFVLEGTELRFELGPYDRSRPLLIDPERIWATYYGGVVYNVWPDKYTTGAVAVDAGEQVYLAGTTYSSTGIAAAGYQQTYRDSGDAFLVKFDSLGQRVWATYLGDGGIDLARAIATDAQGNIYMTGESRALKMIAPNTYSHKRYKAFLAKFDEDGSLIWFFYYGQQLEITTAFDLAADVNGDIYVAGTTSSKDSIAMRGHQQAHGGAHDAFLVKFNGDGQQLWGTYYGGGLYDDGLAVATDRSGHVYLAGTTTSDTGIAAGGHRNILIAGTIDAFLAKFDSNGRRLWATYYGGDRDDRAMAVAADGGSNVYLAGSTDSGLGSLADGGHQNRFGGGQDAFLAKFDSTGQRLWGTYYGGRLQDFGQSVVTDRAGNVYLAGTAGSEEAIASGGYQDRHSGGGLYTSFDAFLVKFSSRGQRIWARYYGGAGDDMGTQAATNGVHTLYLAGFTNSQSNIASGGHQRAFGGEDFHTYFLGAFAIRSLSVESAYPGLQRFRIVPNPVSAQVALEADSSLIGSSYTILDPAGRSVQTGLIQSERTPIDLSGFPGGLYLLRADWYPMQCVKFWKEE